MPDEVLPWDAGRVLRLLPVEIDEHEAVAQFERLDLFIRAGVPAPAVYGIDMAKGRLGVIEDLIVGPTMLARLSARPWQARVMGHELGALQRRIHRLTAPATISPAHGCICHGNLGPEQVLLTDNGPVVVGWQNAYIGRPETDVETTLARIQELRPPDNARLRTLANVGWKRFDSAYRSGVTDVTRPVSGRSSHHRRQRSSRS